MSLDSILAFSKLQQFSVQFACRTATRKELTLSEKNSLKDVLEEADSEFFQKFEDKMNAQPGLFQVFKEYLIGAMTVTAPSFIMNNTSVTLVKPVRLGSKNFVDVRRDMSSLNQNMMQILNKVQTILKGLNYQRAGKIFEFQLGPFTSDEKSRLLGDTLKIDLMDMGELSMMFTKHIDSDGQTYNALTHMGYRQLNLTDPFVINIRIDINNRNLNHSMEPSQIIQVWNKADLLIGDYLDNVFSFQ